MDDVVVIGDLRAYGFAQADRVIWTEGCSPTIITGASRIGHQINIEVEYDEDGEEDKEEAR